jgi:hypothetical protein
MAEAVGTIFSKPDVSDEQLFKARARQRIASLYIIRTAVGRSQQRLPAS